jgi:hypothetical protein
MIIIGIRPGPAPGVDDVSAGPLGHEASEGGREFVLLFITAAAGVGGPMGRGEQDRDFARNIAYFRLRTGWQFLITYIRFEFNETLQKISHYYFGNK